LRPTKTGPRSGTLSLDAQDKVSPQAVTLMGDGTSTPK